MEGRSIARELIASNHEVLLLDKTQRRRSRAQSAVQLSSSPMPADLGLDEAGLPSCQVVVAATGDDKVNLGVVAVAKTEYGCHVWSPVLTHPRTRWLFDDSWGVDVAVSTPRMLSLRSRAVTVGDLVRLMTFRQGRCEPRRIDVVTGSRVVGKIVSTQFVWPMDTALVAVIVRGGRVITPTPDDT